MIKLRRIDVRAVTAWALHTRPKGLDSNDSQFKTFSLLRTCSMPIDISVPASLDLPSVLSFAERVASLPNAESYILDFGRMSHVEPFGMLLVSSEKGFVASSPHKSGGD